MSKIKIWLAAALLAVSVVATAQSPKVNINTATEAELAAALTGVGSARAAAIVAERQRGGPYKSPEDLTRVEGIGKHIVELNRGVIAVVAKKKTAKP